MKLSKRISAVAAAAVISATMVSGPAVSAEEYSCGSAVISQVSAADPKWTEAKKLAGASYNSAYAKMCESYYKKSSKKTVTFGKSLSKKYFEKFEDPSNMKMWMIDKENVIGMAMHGNSVKVVLYMEGEGMAIYLSEKAVSMYDLGAKTYTKQAIDKETAAMLNSSITSGYAEGYMKGTQNLNLKDSDKGKIITTTYKGEKLTYEEFDYDGIKNGILFNSKGMPIAVTDGTNTYCMNISASVKSADFKEPTGYKLQK